MCWWSSDVQYRPTWTSVLFMSCACDNSDSRLLNMMCQPSSPEVSMERILWYLQEEHQSWTREILSSHSVRRGSSSLAVSGLAVHSLDCTRTNTQSSLSIFCFLSAKHDLLSACKSICLVANTFLVVKLYHHSYCSNTCSSNYGQHPVLLAWTFLKNQ